MSIFPTGRQYQIAAGQYSAVVTEAGATLRSLSYAGHELLWTFEADQAPKSSMGRQLVPWPNRIADGRYRFDGVEYQLPITEVERNTALHGLGEAASWVLVSSGADFAELTTTLFPQQGWNAILKVTVRYEVDAAAGLLVSVDAQNVGPNAAPYGYGAHPFFAADLSTAELQHSFATELLVDPERLLPIELADITPDFDFRAARPVGDVVFDTAFTGVEERWLVTLQGPAERIEVWADETLGWCQLYTPPTRDALAIEPMTCGPNAFNEGPTDQDLIVIQPGDSSKSQWGVRVI